MAEYFKKYVVPIGSKKQILIIQKYFCKNVKGEINNGKCNSIT